MRGEIKGIYGLFETDYETLSLIFNTITFMKTLFIIGSFLITILFIWFSFAFIMWVAYGDIYVYRECLRCKGILACSFICGLIAGLFVAFEVRNIYFN